MKQLQTFSTRQTLTVATLLLAGVLLAGCATHEVLEVTTEEDVNLTCSELAQQKQEARDILAKVEDDEEEVSGGEAAASVLSPGISWIANAHGNKRVTVAAYERIEVLEGLEKEKGCN